MPSDGGGARISDDVGGFFGPGSTVWKVDRELVVLLGGGFRALLMQVAHPSVAAGVAQHSRYRSDPLGRLLHTLKASYGFAFADRPAARALVDGVNRRHARVRGILEQSTGSHSQGESYRAMDPWLLLWVYATLIDSSMVAYEAFVGPLPDWEREAYYAEGRREGVIWGIPSQIFPESFSALRFWMREQVATGVVAVGPQGREIARLLLRPPAPWIPGPVMLPTVLTTAWLLPARLREQFGFSWGPRRERLMRTGSALSRALVPLLPPLLRDMPIARAAERRIELATRRPVGSAGLYAGG